MAGTQSSGMIKQQFHGNNYDQLDRRPTCNSRLERFRMRPKPKSAQQTGSGRGFGMTSVREF